MNSPLRSPILRGDDTHIDSQLVHDASEIIDIIHERETRNFRLGVVLIVVAVLTWIIGLELVNSVLKDDSYQKPMMFALITGSCFSLNLIPDIINFFKPKEIIPQEKFDNDPLPLNKVEVFWLSFQIAVIYLVYNICALSGLKYTSASNQTVLSSTTSIFTLFIGYFLNTDAFTLKKIICTLVSFSGVLLVNFSETKSFNGDNDNKFIPKNPKLGNMLSVMGALMYAFYLIIMKVKLGNANRTTNETRLFGFMGLITIVLSGPVLFILDYYGIEKFQFPPPNNTVLLVVVANGVLSYVSDFVTILASLLTSPLITSLSLTSSIPITIFIDLIILHITGGKSNGSKNLLLYISGIVSILVSVVLINLNSTTELELIEQSIDKTLDEAIRNDEMLSPVLSPILSSRPHSRFSSPLLPTRRDPIHKPSKLNLEGDQLINRNHSHLYTVPNEEEDDSPQMIVYGGNNHVYHVKHIDDN
ncbi:hypothetical protein CLIB1444_13S01002 [[Candida] jaroonii]|uniref:Uncharacterized protein n=1 Tax=[Candida] jaroonii TaxID=467808 RepID=A0ACA9YDI4_9ASCO|nr:hypothetical protein CLIB1444_13S01002 [[Candida] jaroonii]